MTINFKSATSQANDILKADKAKLQWKMLPFSDMPRDIQAMAVSAVEAAIAARDAKAALQAALDDKVEAPSGKRLIVTLGRDVGPNTDGVLYAWTTASTSGTKVVSFNEFVKG